MSGGVGASGVTGAQLVVGTGRSGIGRDADSVLGCGTNRGGRGYGRDGGGDGINRWEDTVANVILGKDPNAPLDYALGLELHHPIMNMLGGYGGRLYIEINDEAIACSLSGCYFIC